MAEIPLQVASLRKLAVNLLQAAVGDTAQVGNNKFLVVQNTSGAGINVTIAMPGLDFTGTAIPDLVETVANNEVAIIPLGNQYADATTTPPGQAVITYGSVPATLKRAVVALV